MTLRVEVKPELLRWACARARLDIDALLPRFPKLPQWLSGDAQPTFKQLERFAKATHTPIGYLFLPAPIVEEVPIPDFRTIGNAYIDQPTPDLLETVYVCQQRQEWFREHARDDGQEALAFIGSARVGDDVEATAARMRATLGFTLDDQQNSPSWTETLRRFIERSDAAGVLVMVSGIVGSNTHRVLNPEEFRGFALTDAYAPLVFINGADTKAAQMFTLAHELAHLWLGLSAVTDVAPVSTPTQSVERWCNDVAAEFLVPRLALKAVFHRDEPLRDALARLAKHFKVSTLVILRRLHDIGGLTRTQLTAAYRDELERLEAMTRRRGGGADRHRSTTASVGKRFAQALVVTTLAGRTSFMESFRLLGLRNLATFHKFGRSLGVGV